MFRLKSRSVLCTPSSGLSRALGALNVDDENDDDDAMKSSARDDENDDVDVDDARFDDDDDARRSAETRSQGRDADARAMSTMGTQHNPSASAPSQEGGGLDFITPADAQFDAYGAYGEDGG